MAPVPEGRKRRRVVAALALALVVGALPAGGPGPAQAAPGEGEWSSAGSLLVPRFQHTATRLDDGSVLVAGGAIPGTASAGRLSAVERYHPSTGWSVSTPLNVPRTSHTATLLSDGAVLVVGGTTERGPPAVGTTEIFDPDEGTWRTCLRETASDGCPGPLNTWRQYGHTATLLDDGRVLVVGGRDPTAAGVTYSAEVYSPGNGTWTDVSPPPGPLRVPRGGHTATLLADGRVLVAGGGSGGAPQLFDPTDGSWSATPDPDMVVNRSGHSATRLKDGKVLVLGGSDGTLIRSTGELYDPSTGSWSPLPSDMGTARQLHRATLLANGNVLVTGGEGSDTAASVGHSGAAVLASAKVFNPGDGGPGDGGWTRTDDMEEPRKSHTATLLENGNVLVAGGSPTGASAQLYQPGAASLLAPPRVAGISPSRGPQYGGTTVTITGSGFSAGGELAVNFGEVTAAGRPTIVSDGELRVESPAHPPGTVHVTVSTTVGVSAPHALDQFSFLPTSGTWWTRASFFMAYTRAEHTATNLSGPNCGPLCGRVLAVGGTYLETSALGAGPARRAEVFDPVAGTWQEAATLAAGRFGHTATHLNNGRVMVAGGQDAANIAKAVRHSSVELFDPTTPPDPRWGSWNPAPPMAVPRFRHTATLLHDGKVLVAGGDRAGTAEIFDPAAATGQGAWSTCPAVAASAACPGALNVARAEHAAALVSDGPGGKVLVVGGCVVTEPQADGTPSCAEQPTATGELFDPTTGRWAPTAAPLPGPGRHNLTATRLNDGRVLVVGGATAAAGACRQGPSTDAVSIYNPADGTWSQGGSLLLPRARHTATLLPNGKVLVAGGESWDAQCKPQIAASAELYEPATDTWSYTTRLNLGRSRHTATLLPAGPASSCGTKCGQVLALGGFTPQANGSADITAGELFAAEPEVSSVSPDVGPGPGGVTVTISGTGLSAATTVHFGGEAARDVRVDPATPDTKLTAVAPAHPLGAVDVVVTTRPDPDGDPLRSLARRLFTYSDTFTDPFTDPVTGTCADVVAGPGQLAYPSGYSLVGLPHGTRVRAQSALFGWLDAGAEKTGYDVNDPATTAVAGGQGYWAWFRCPTLVDLAPPSASSLSLPLGAYHASMVGNPSDRPAIVSGHDFAARWNAASNSYIISGFKDAQRLEVGEGAWVFSYEDTTITITPQ